MSQWVAISEIVRNLAIAIAATIGAILAWRQLSPASLQAKSASTQADLARLVTQSSYSIAQLVNFETQTSKSDSLQSKSVERLPMTFLICRTLFLSCFKPI